MRRFSIILAIFVSFTMLSSPDSAAAQGELEPGGQEAAMQVWLDAMTPGAKHEKLDAFAGDWKTTTRMWMAGPDGPATESPGTSAMTWTLGGRYLRLKVDGMMMGMPFEGEGFLGYDNVRKHYTMTWLDTFSTAVGTSSGQFDPEGRTLTLYGVMDEPMIGEFGRHVKYVWKIAGKDRLGFEVHDLALPEGMSKAVEAEYRRR